MTYYDVLSACGVKTNYCLFERFFKVNKNHDIFLSGISFFFVLETFTFLYNLSEESDDVIGHEPVKKQRNKTKQKHYAKHTTLKPLFWGKHH